MLSTYTAQSPMPPLYWPKCAIVADRGIPDSESSGPPSDNGPAYSPTDACDVMTPYVPDPQSTLPLRPYLKELILESSDGNRQVFRAELREVDLSSGTLTPRKRDVVCKVAYGQRRIHDLQHEADCYNTKLLGLQGTVVPKMFGCFQGYTGDGHTAVLILEYCGVRLTYDLRLYSPSFRVQVIQALLAVHKAGLKHHSFCERNILISKGANGDPRVVLVNFELSSEHTCKALQQIDIDNIVPYQRMPQWFDCSEINVAFQERAVIWFDGTIDVLSRLVPAEHTGSVEAVLEYTGVPSNMTIEEARSAIQTALDEKAQRLAEELAIDANSVHIQWGADEEDE
ncbi:hypothetical protein FKP32DRAFT_1762357 [Trametes sanguinea]|nr:hypothetical protein FKP32DRAFT_1762357 [Trametes sanguinea]